MKFSVKKYIEGKPSQSIEHVSCPLCGCEDFSWLEFKHFKHNEGELFKCSCDNCSNVLHFVRNPRLAPRM